MEVTAIQQTNKHRITVLS